MTKIVVDHMPESFDECPFKQHKGFGLWCGVSNDMCNGPETCVRLIPHCLFNENYKPMSPNDYQQACLRTESVSTSIATSMGASQARILQGLMGLNGEAGECIDILKKVMFQGHTLDKEHLAKELGDVAWYLAVSADAIGYDLEKIFKMNIEKLRKRYPDGFEADKSIHRSDSDV